MRRCQKRIYPSFKGSEIRRLNTTLVDLTRAGGRESLLSAELQRLRVRAGVEEGFRQLRTRRLQVGQAPSVDPTERRLRVVSGIIAKEQSAMPKQFSMPIYLKGGNGAVV